MEFVVFFGITIVLFLGVAVIVYQEKTDLVSQSESTNVQSFAISVQNEIMIAATMVDGFSRSMSLPQTINDKNYSIKIISSNLYVDQDQEEVILPLPAINGTITNRTFLIVKNVTGMYIQ